ncbi:MAG TPA: hypothetical protein VEC36_05940 [Patescibacteria group bacterium]|nr:hypothetical protein [Patescibacteria group bacterium]
MQPTLERTIPRAQALALLEKTEEDEDGNLIAVPFSITFMTLDINRDTGGELITMKNCVLAKNRGLKIKGLYLLAKKSDSQTVLKHEKTKKAKQSNEWENKTRNIYCIDSESIRKCNIEFITRVNGIKVRPS